MTEEQTRKLLDTQRAALDAHRWAMPQEEDVTPAEQALWDATQAAVYALEDALRAAPTPPEWCNAESVKPRDGDDPFVWNDHDALEWQKTLAERNVGRKESPVAPPVSPTRLKLGLAYAAGWDARSEHPEGELYGPDEPFDTLQRQWVDAALASPVGETPDKETKSCSR